MIFPADVLRRHIHRIAEFADTIRKIVFMNTKFFERELSVHHILSILLYPYIREATVLL